MQNAIGKSRIGGVTTTLEFLASIISSDCKYYIGMNSTAITSCKVLTTTSQLSAEDVFLRPSWIISSPSNRSGSRSRNRAHSRPYSSLDRAT